MIGCKSKPCKEHSVLQWFTDGNQDLVYAWQMFVENA